MAKTTIRGSEVAAIRRNYNVTQRQFAAILNLPERTVENWEAGQRSISSAPAALLRIVRDFPDVFYKLKKAAHGR